MPPQTRAFVRGLSLMMAVMAVLRLVFVIVNRDTFSTFGTSELVVAFINGIRFDLHVILLLMGFFFLILHIPGCIRSTPVFLDPTVSFGHPKRCYFDSSFEKNRV